MIGGIIGAVAGQVAGNAHDMWMRDRAMGHDHDIQNKSMAWQEKMYDKQVHESRNKYGYAMADMKRSGLNPTLAAGGPATSAASAGSASGGSGGGAAGSAKQAFDPLVFAQAKLLKKQAEVASAQAAKIRAETPVKEVISDAATTAKEGWKKIKDKIPSADDIRDRDYKYAPGWRMQKPGKIGKDNPLYKQR